MASVGAVIVHPQFRHTLPPPPAPPCTWDDLPENILYKVTSYLDTAEDLCRFANISHRCRNSAYNEEHWYNLCVEKFSVPANINKPPSWRELYKFNHDFFYRVVVAGALPALLNLYPPGAAQAFRGVIYA